MGKWNPPDPSEELSEAVNWYNRTFKWRSRNGVIDSGNIEQLETLYKHYDTPLPFLYLAEIVKAIDDAILEKSKP